MHENYFANSKFLRVPYIINQRERENLFDPITDDIPVIFHEYCKIFRDHTHRDKSDSVEYKTSKFAQIVMYPMSYSSTSNLDNLNENESESDNSDENNSNIFSNEDGHMIEHMKTTNRENVTFVSVDDNEPHYAIGTLLLSHYPSIKTLALNRYRMWPENVIKCENLDIDHFMGIGRCGNVYDNPFNHVEKLPQIKWFLFDDGMYHKVYAVCNDCTNKREEIKNFTCECKNKTFFKEFEKVLKLKVKMEGIMFFVMKREKLYCCPEGWSCRTLDFPNQNETSWYWVIYEKTKL